MDIVLKINKQLETTQQKNKLAYVCSGTHLVLIKNWAAPIVSGVPVIVTFRSGDPSSALEILIVAPDACLLAK